jgi:hypothetical protein
MLEPSADEVRDWGQSIAQFMIEYLGGLRDRPAIADDRGRAAGPVSLDGFGVHQRAAV